MERDQADSLLPILEEPIPENDLEETPKEPTNPDAFIDHSIIPEVLGQPARSENASSAQEDQAKGPRHSNGSNISTPSLFQAFKTKAWKTLLGHEDLDEWRSTLSEQRSRLQTREESLRSRKEQIDDADLREIKELERRENELDQRQMGLEELEDQLNQREIRLDEWEERLDQRGMELDQQEARLEELEYAFQTWKDQLRSQEGQLEVLDTHMCEANARDGHIGNRVREPWQRQEIFNQRGKRLNEQQSTVQTWKEQSQLGGKEHSHAGSREQDPRDKVIRARVGELGLREVTFVQREEQVQSQEEQLGASKREQRPKDLEEPNQETGCCPQPSMEKANVSESSYTLQYVRILLNLNRGLLPRI
ncbi:hypothetical protein CC78DRAFT_212995 [Lojkania enalia]|uniref:Uncharacterized protein n=1 Tax=Lojkania enalia TaxID=147567 RepID=A0A9P4KFF6_9PLEO|nr:hypothetical protein CC78DRAFT_212995 [Didymosphaeria enalia]